jgi:hypothetical protein
VEICTRSAADTSPKSIRSGLSSAGTSPKTTATPGSTSARTIDAVVESMSELGVGSSTTGESAVLLWPFSSGSAISIESEGSCMRSPPREGAQRPDVDGVHCRSVRLDALRFSGNPRPVAPRTLGFTRATTGRLMLASSDHATAMPHSARISRCVIPRTNRPHLPLTARRSGVWLHTHRGASDALMMRAGRRAGGLAGHSP